MTIVSEAGCQAVHEEALRLMGLEGQIRLFDLPAPGTLPAEDWLRAFWREHPHTTHLISIERAGPSHTLTSLLASYGQEPAPLLAFTTEVDAASWDKPHNMRGYDISPFTAPAHLLFESRPPGVVTIGIGDGGNEIGMGKLPWEVLRANIVLGGKIACRVPTQHLLVAGTSNWGAYALAAGLLQCRGRSLSSMG